MQHDEAALIRRAQAGEAEAFNQLVLATQRFVYNLALKGVGDGSEAQDIAQEAYLRAWLALPRFRGEARFRTWLYRIVINLCYNRLPRLKQEIDALPVEEPEGIEDGSGPGAGAYLRADPEGDPALQVEKKERLAFLHRMIEELPQSYRLLAALRFQQDLSYEEMAQVMDLPLGTVKTGIHRLRGQLRRALEAYEEVKV